MHKTNIKDFLSNLKGKRIYYWSNPGNAGDALIAHATYLLFDHLDLDYQIISDTSEIKNAIIVFAGGGNLVEGKYHHMYEALMKCVDHNKCIVLPHTIFGFRDLIKYTHTNLTLFCRDKVSYQMCALNSANLENLYLSDDMAFFLPKNYFDDLNRKSSGRAICLREDSESTNIFLKPKDNLDISKSWNGALWQNKDLAKYVTWSLASYLSYFDEIETDRLHVSILGFLMQKKVILYPNNYYKNRAVFENSMVDNQEYQNTVSFINTSTDLLHSEYVNNLLKSQGFI